MALVTPKPPPMGRRDLLAIKQQLADALSDNGPLYWRALTDFVTGKLNHQEFDFYAHLYIPADQVHLHNTFILATIHNAHRDDRPPLTGGPVVEWSRKRCRDDAGGSGGDGANNLGRVVGADGRTYFDENDEPLDPVEQQRLRREKLKKLIQSMSKVDRRTIRQLLKRDDAGQGRPLLANAGGQASRRPVLPFAVDQILASTVADYARGVQAPLCVDERAVPDVDTLRHRLGLIALEHGLIDGATAEAAQIVMFGLDVHLRNIIANCISKVRGAPPVVSHHAHLGSVEPRTTTGTDSPTGFQTLRLADLLFSVEISPYVLTEVPLSIERLAAVPGDDGSSDEDGNDGDNNPGTSSQELASRARSGTVSNDGIHSGARDSPDRPRPHKTPRLTVLASPAVGIGSHTPTLPK
ncbi:hypothetical protein IWQ60_001310 [Tieghemiomyces parasiticus]|uniref:Transcriptional coactivator HFI1/ADA1 n=1 Tax=Tieghemiomyces parasiticus TaxID=78921 RepID=A0A9W8DYE7_9FUNG|nr:hypothetical protein IWQ60_001310 [Tieghemiomyces parasiticus]